MASDCKERRPLLYADLFKPSPKPAAEGSASACSSWTESLPCDSSSSASGFSTPFGSEFGSSESDDGDFTGELTRQMAECMLREDENEGGEEDPAKSIAESTRHVYQVENRPRVKKRVHPSRGRRVKETELTHRSPLDKTEQPYVGMGYRGRDRRVGNVQNGSDMRVVFLGGPGPRSGLNNGSAGTGVFLPRTANEPVSVQPKKKSGCPTVLIPTRVLEVLEQHFNRKYQDSAGPPLRPGSDYAQDEPHMSNGQRNRHSQASNTDEELQLPQEWTY